MEALNITSASIASIELAKSTSPFAARWNTGEYSGGLPNGAAGIPNGLYTIGASASVPLAGGIRVGFGVSKQDSVLDVGVIIDTPVLGIGFNHLYLNKWGIDGAYQKGDFLSNNGALNQSYKFGWGRFGGIVTRDQAGFSGASIGFGPQYGAEVGGQQSRTASIRYPNPLSNASK